jgi:hypothetical protein
MVFKIKEFKCFSKIISSKYVSSSKKLKIASYSTLLIKFPTTHRAWGKR